MNDAIERAYAKTWAKEDKLTRLRVTAFMFDRAGCEMPPGLVAEMTRDLLSYNEIASRCKAYGYPEVARGFEANKHKR